MQAIKINDKRYNVINSHSEQIGSCSKAVYILSDGEYIYKLTMAAITVKGKIKSEPPQMEKICAVADLRTNKK